MTFRYLSMLKKRKKLQANLRKLENEKERLTQHLNKTQSNDRNNIRQSDRKFKENSNKALSARTKRANKADIQRINQQIKSNKRQLNDINSLLGNLTLGRFLKVWKKRKQSIAKFWEH